ncbi:CD166 antigen [Callorhinchus milii]|uniref:Ig-like domain-containing protein n=1 Tax=Callorhinchus milii TaxID=7868 RepID=A0A4W3K8E1_CALMI|nr:CD166 antigen [Callorhinchus milii]|eukprot:gi/632956483/ref/XP_007893980.1/ PREDICTED: CD166 antigen [Callorhinchus milii]
MGSFGARILCCQSLILMLGTVIQALEGVTVTAHVGDTITLDCPVRLHANPTVVGWNTEIGKLETLAGINVLTGITTNVNVTEYEGRIVMSKNYSLTISDISIKDERKFNCFVLYGIVLEENPVTVRVFKIPSAVHLTQTMSFLNEGKMQQVGTCTVNGSFPQANITWQMNNENIKIDDPAVAIDQQNANDQNGYFITDSTLKYLSKRDEQEISFKCIVHYFESPTKKAKKVSKTAHVKIHYNTSKIMLKVSPEKAIREGDKVTLSCSGDGYPVPELFTFKKNGELQTSGKTELILNSVNRNDTGEYECSMNSDPSLKDAKNITVHYVDLTISPSGLIKKKLGENITVNCKADASGTVSIVLKKKDIEFLFPYTVDSLEFKNSGIYTCQAKIGELPGVKIKQTMELQVEGEPHIIRLTKKVLDDSKQITCAVEGFPRPSIKWNVNGTIQVDKAKNITVHKLTFKPLENMTVSCTAQNSYGQDEKDLNVTSMKYKEDDNDKNLEKEIPDNKDKAEKSNKQAMVIVGVIVGLVIAAVITGVAYWFCKKRASKTNESGTAEEIKKIHTDDNNHTPGAVAI